MATHTGALAPGLTPGDDFSTIVKAVELGRGLYDNLVKYMWINFTTLLFQAVGLGYGRPAAGLMEREPRQPDQPILTRPLFVWLISVGLITGPARSGSSAGPSRRRSRTPSSSSPPAYRS